MHDPTDPIEAPPAPPATRAQRLVRAAIVAAFLALIASVPALHLYSHVLRREPGPLLLTTAQTPAPQPTIATVLDGSYMHDLEHHLQEDSATVWLLRGSYDELRLRLGLLQNASVYVADDGWMFLRRTLRMDPALLKLQLEHHAEILRAVAAEIAASGVRVLAVVAPDKERIYPEFAYPAGTMPPHRQALYGTILDHLARANVPTLDVAQILLTARHTSNELLYLQRDTHWSQAGAAVVAAAIAERLQQPDFAAALGPTVAYAAQQTEVVRIYPDLAAMCGLLGYDYMVGADRRSATPGPMANAMREDRTFWHLRLQDPRIAPQSLRPDAAIALAGSSFSVGILSTALAMATQRPIDDRCASPGSCWHESIRAALAAIRRGDAKARIVVWEFVERHWYEQR